MCTALRGARLARLPRREVRYRVARLPRLDEPIERGLEGHLDPVLLGLAHEGAVDQLDLGRPPRLDVLEHRGEVPVAAPGREHVHLPRVVVQLDTGRGGDRLALVDEIADEMAKVGEPLGLGEVEVVGEARQRGDAVHRRVEDQLRPLRRAQIGERLRLQPARDDQLRDPARVRLRRAAVGADPGGGVEDVLDVRVAVTRAAHERDRGEERPLAVRRHDLLRTEPVLDRHHGRSRERAFEPRRERLEVGALARQDRELGVGGQRGRCRRSHRAAR